MMKRIELVLALSVLVASVGAVEYYNQTLLDHSPFAVELIDVATWNTGLFPWLDPTQVVSHIPKDVAVLGLQEIWDPTVAADVAAKMKHYYPYSFYVTPKTGQIGCDFSDQLVQAMGYGFVGCLIQFGLNTTTLSFSDPIPEDCLQLGLGVLYYQQQCAACIINELHHFAAGETAFQALGVCAQQQGEQYMFGGSAGILLLSKRPIHNVRVEEFTSFLVRRVNIYFQVGHLTFALSHFPFDQFGGMIPIVQDLQPQLAAAMITSGSDILLADFNSGSSYQAAAYNELIDTGYVDTFPGAITYCPADFASQIPECLYASPLDIDHIFFKSQTLSEVFWQHSALFNNKVAYSDHIGVRVTGFALLKNF